jgi:hypothetical protein
MADVNVKRCDRVGCGRFCRDEETFVSVVVFHESEDTDREALDLCDACEGGLHRYLGGAKLARPRKVVQS